MTGGDLERRDNTRLDYSLGQELFTFERAMQQLRDEGAVNFPAITEVIPLGLQAPLLDEVRERARRRLRAQGFSETELSDEKVIEVLRLRHILMELHRKKVPAVEGETLLPQLISPDSNPEG